MSIEKAGKDDFYIECNGCGATIHEDFEDFYEAVDWKKDNRHLCQSAKSPDGEWADFCPECVQAGLAQKFRNGGRDGGNKQYSGPPLKEQWGQQGSGKQGRKSCIDYTPELDNNPFDGYDSIK